MRSNCLATAQVRSRSASWPWETGRTIATSPPQRPRRPIASLPKATRRFRLKSTAAIVGSSTTTPRPGTATRVRAVPKSTARSAPTTGPPLVEALRTGPLGSSRSRLPMSRASRSGRSPSRCRSCTGRPRTPRPGAESTTTTTDASPSAYLTDPVPNDRPAEVGPLFPGCLHDRFEPRQHLRRIGLVVDRAHARAPLGMVAHRPDETGHRPA